MIIMSLSKLQCLKQFTPRLRYFPGGCHNQLVSATLPIIERSSQQRPIILLSQHREKNQYHGFGHGREKMSRFKIIYQLGLCAGLVFLMLGAPSKLLEWMRVDAAVIEEEKSPATSDGEEEEKKPKKEKVGFRDRKVIEYENRIRAYSTPDKIFRYFASLKVDGEIYMTPDDFVRSITPGLKQPEGLGLDQFKKFDPKDMKRERVKLQANLGEESIFYKLSESGLLSFSDYLFLLTILSTPHRHLRICFEMFDFDGDGTVSPQEFNKVSDMLRAQSSAGMRHRDTGSNVYRGTNSALERFFFGENRDKLMTIDQFLDFQRQLQEDLLRLEFQRYDAESGRISETDFARIMTTYGGYNPKKRAEMLKRVKKKFKDNPEGISFKEYLDFFHLLKNINDVDTALTFYHMAGASIDAATLQHVGHTVANVRLSPHLVDVVFTIFDENDDGELSNREFVSVMKQRTMRGLERPKDTGFIKLISAVYKCAKHQGQAIWEGN